MQTTIYRTGLMSASVHDEAVLQHWAEFDSRRPRGHISRSEALFASPDIQGGAYWLNDRAILTFNGHKRVIVFNEVTVESDNVRVYRVSDYSMVGYHYNSPTPEQITGINKYWNTSMTLTDWITEISEDYYGEWEVLLTESEVISSRVVPFPELREMYKKEEMDDYRLERLDEELRPLLEISEVS